MTWLNYQNWAMENNGKERKATAGNRCRNVIMFRDFENNV